MKKYLNNILLGLFLVSSPLTGFQGVLTANVYSYTPEQVQTAHKASQTVNNAPEIEKWVEKLEEYETSIVPEENKDSFRLLDTNGYYSYSCLQYQMNTFLWFYNDWKGTNYKLYENITLEEARELISDCDIQKEMTTWIIKKYPNRAYHWKNSIERGFGLPPNHPDYTG